MPILDDLRAQAASQPRSTEAWNRLGYALLSRGGTVPEAEAEEAFNRALSMAADDGAALMGLARVALARKHGDQAIALLKRVVHLSHEVPTLRLHAAHRLCDLLVKGARMDDARDALRDAAMIASTSGEASPAWLGDLTWCTAPFWWAPVVGRCLTLRRPIASDAEWLKRSFMDDVFANTVNRTYAAKVRGMPVDRIAAQLGAQSRQSPAHLGAQLFLIERHGIGPIGIASFVSIDTVSRRAEFIVGFVGDVPHSVVVMELSVLLAEFAFRRAGLHKVTAVCYGDNPRVESLGAVLEKVGFLKEGMQREHVRVADGRYVDVHLWGGLARDLLGNVALCRSSRRLMATHLDSETTAPREGRV